MAQVNFKGNDEDATTGGSGGKFPTAPRGFYTLQISDYEAAKTGPSAKNPNCPMYKMTCEICDEGDYFGTRVFHNVTLIPRGVGEKAKPGHGIAIHFLHSIGIESVNGEFDFDDSEFQGRQFRALLEVEPYDKEVNGVIYNNEKNVVREIYNDKHPQPKELPPPPKTPKNTTPLPAQKLATAGIANDKDTEDHELGW